MGNTNKTPILDNVSTTLKRIAELARKLTGKSLLSLAHHIDIALLHKAYALTRKDGVPGIDDVTAQEYAQELEKNLQSLLDRFKSGTYKAPPVRRAHIPKADGGQRALGIPTFEDKVLQRAVTMVLEAVYEQDFLPTSYGYRPRIGALHALRDLRQELMAMGGGWVLEADIRSFFDKMVHGHLRSFLDQRVRDGVIRRMIDKWLKAGVIEEGRIHFPEDGSPQGGVISPLLANIYLHEVGYYNYFGITCNLRALAQLFRSVCSAWRYWLSRRSQRASIRWLDFEFAEHFQLPRPRIVHHWV